MPLLAVIHRRARLEFRISGFRFLRLIGCTGEGTKVDGGDRGSWDARVAEGGYGGGVWAKAAKQRSTDGLVPEISSG